MLQCPVDTAHAHMAAHMLPHDASCLTRARAPPADNDIGDEGAAALARANWPSLAMLNLEHDGIGDEGAAALASANWPSLATLNVAHNKIGDEGAAALAEALKTNSTLTFLKCVRRALLFPFSRPPLPTPHRRRLIQSRIGDEGATALAKALTANITLTGLE